MSDEEFPDCSGDDFDDTASFAASDDESYAYQSQSSDDSEDVELALLAAALAESAAGEDAPHDGDGGGETKGESKNEHARVSSSASSSSSISVLRLGGGGNRVDPGSLLGRLLSREGGPLFNAVWQQVFLFLAADGIYDIFHLERLLVAVLGPRSPHPRAVLRALCTTRGWYEQLWMPMSVAVGRGGETRTLHGDRIVFANWSTQRIAEASDTGLDRIDRLEGLDSLDRHRGEGRKGKKDTKGDKAGKEEHSCDLCDKVFKKDFALANHRKKEHKAELAAIKREEKARGGG